MGVASVRTRIVVRVLIPQDEVLPFFEWRPCVGVRHGPGGVQAALRCQSRYAETDESCEWSTLMKRDHGRTKLLVEVIKGQTERKLSSGSDGEKVCDRLCCYNHLPCSRLHAVSSVRLTRTCLPY
jgi:hypothetical protein